MRVHVIRPADLSDDLIAAWQQILDETPALDSPYFRPEFVQAVASVRPDVHIGVVEDGARPVAFFPFQRGRWGVGRPVGGRLSDFQAVIVRDLTPWSVRELLHGCRLSAWEFDHLLTHQVALAPFHAVVAESPYIDLGRGFERYKQTRREAGSDAVAQTLRKRRKIQREIGRLRFVAQVEDEAVFDRLLAWKSAQYRRTDETDLFEFPWTVALLERLWRAEGPGMAGMLSAIYVDDQLVAAHFGMRTRSVLHWWFPAHNRDYDRYSPGLALLTSVAEAAESLGIRRIDLGKGSEEYKTSFATGAVGVAEGAVDLRPLAGSVRAGWRTARRWLRSSSRAPVRVPVRWLRRIRDRRAFR